MKILRPAALAMMAILSFAGAQAADDAADHAAHHPAAPAAAAGAPATKHKLTKPDGGAAAAEHAAAVDKQIAVMQAMHEKMMAAKTPEERQALMGEHMKVMQDSMAMMGANGKSGGDGPMEGMQPPKVGGMQSGMMSGMRMHHEAMEKRLDMMESMMQMMMDRMPSAADK